MEKKGHAARARGKSIKLADRLRAVQNNAGLHHYVYDGTGTRILKGSLLQNSTQQNGESGSNGYTLTPYTVYPNAYTVCTFYRDDVDITNHYYAGAQRVASKLDQSAYKLDFSTTVDEGPRDPEGPEAGTGGTSTPTSFIYHQPTPNNVVLTDGLDAIIRDILPAQQFATPVSISMNDLIALGLPGRLPADLGAYPPCEEGSFDPYQIPQDWQLGYFDCLCNYYPQLAEDFNINCQLYSSIYWYHPDYLGNTEFVTDAGGYPYQFFYYSAFGESLVQQHANTGSFATPYKFNAKELDPETGNYYYGARYYNPQVSVWLSVDAMATNAHNLPLTPYHFSANNPVMIIDPDGNDWYENENTGDVMFLKAGKGALTDKQVEQFGEGWNQIGEDDMFGNDVEYNGFKVLSAKAVQFQGKNAEKFMGEQGYKISTEMTYERWEFTALDWEGGIGDTYETTSEDYRLLDVKFSYVQPENFTPEKEVVKDEFTRGMFYRQRTTTTWFTSLGRNTYFRNRTNYSSNSGDKLVNEGAERLSDKIAKSLIRLFK